MQFISLFRQIKASKLARRVEPEVKETATGMALPTDWKHVADDPEPAFDVPTSSNVHAPDDLLSLFDQADESMGTARATHASSLLFVTGDTANKESDELMRTLHAHYCAALDTSHHLPPGSWEPLLTDTAASQVTTFNALDADGPAHADLSISQMFAEPQRLEEAIGPLDADAEPDHDDLNLAAVPEILALFAPEEYREGAALRERFVPSALARREHHSLAIDSPLFDLNGSLLQLDRANAS